MAEINDIIKSYEDVFEDDSYFKDKITFKNRFIYFDNKRLDWKKDKSLFRTIVARSLDIKKTDIDYDILNVALMNVAKQHQEEDTNDLIVAKKYAAEFFEIEDLLDEIENDETLSDEKDDWAAYRDWKNNVALKTYNSDGEVTGISDCYDNIVGWLDNYPVTKGKLRYNELSLREDIWDRMLENNDIHTIMNMLNKHFIRDYSKLKGLREAISGCANRHHYNPFKEYIEGLRYDDSRDWIEFLVKDVLKAEMYEEYGDLYVAEMKKWIYACVKRIYEPGSKFDNILVLVSENQGTGKSSIWERLFRINDESLCKVINASQDIPQGDRFAQQCAAKVCINFDEIATKAKNVNIIKTMLSQQNDEFHKLYDMVDAPVNRKYVFVGTTNNNDVLKDYTSMFERRWWFIKITEDTCNGVYINTLFDDKELKLRDNIWAQAKHMYDNKTEQDLYITEDSELGQKLMKLQRGYKASNNEDYEQIVTIMQMDWGFFDEKKMVNIDSLIKQYKSGDVIKYCKDRNAELEQLFSRDDYIAKPEDKKYVCYGQIDVWPVALLNELLNKLGIKYTRQSLNNELKHANEFIKKNYRSVINNNNTCLSWVRKEETPVNKFNEVNYESEGVNELPF